MSLPKPLTIGIFEYTFIEDDTLFGNHDKWGLTNLTDKRVRVAKEATGVNLIDTVVHELLHAISGEWLPKGAALTEDQVQTLAHGLTQILGPLATWYNEQSRTATATEP